MSTSTTPIPTNIISRGRRRINNVPSHGNTKVSKANLQIEASLKSGLNQIVQLIRSEVVKRADTKVFAPSWIDLYGRVRPVLESKTYDLIREAATESYLLGIRYVAKQILKKPVYITTDDIDIIKQLADHYNGQLWNRIQIIVYHQSSNEQNYPDSLVNFTVVNLCSESLYRATVEKTRKLTD